MTLQLDPVTKVSAPDMQWEAVQLLGLASKATDKIAHASDLNVAPVRPFVIACELSLWYASLERQCGMA